MPDVFAHGMLSAAYLGHVPTCTGTITEKFEVAGEKRVKIAIRCGNQHGEEKLVGEAIVALA
jgi:hypothetical protein